MIDVCFECEEFTETRSSKHHRVPDEFCSNREHKTYSYASENAKRKEWYSLEDGEGFEFKKPELKKEPEFGEGDKETATGKDYYTHIMEIVETEEEDSSMERIAPKARNTDDIDELRSLCSETEKRLEEEGFKPENVGVECTKSSTWKERRQETPKKDLFDFLVMDAVETHLQFYKENLGYKTDGGLIVAVLDEGEHYSCPDNIARSFKWQMKIGPKKELKSKQQTLEAIA